VKAHYDLFIPPDVPHNSQDALSHTIERVTFLLDKGVFLRAEELDSQVCMLNINPHPYRHDIIDNIGEDTKLTAQSDCASVSCVLL
jgi:hypothetical protein